jgi:hypothetical protein
MSTKIIIKAVSSSGDYYHVHFEVINRKLNVFCDCPAGIHGKLCKHKIGLLQGDSSKLFDQTDKDKLIQVQEFVSKTNYIDIIKIYNKVKAEVEEAQKKEAKVKAEIESAIKEGLELVHE